MDTQRIPRTTPNGWRFFGHVLWAGLLAIATQVGCAPILTGKIKFRQQAAIHCYTLIDNLHVYAMDKDGCPDRNSFEFNYRAWRRMLDVQPGEMAGYNMVMAGGRIADCGGIRNVVGCSDPDVAYVDSSTRWLDTAVTIMEELGHRLCWKRYGTMDPYHEKPCYVETRRVKVYPGEYGAWHSH
jgi:hypothetical protein